MKKVLTKATKLIEIVLQINFTKPNGIIFLLHGASYLYSLQTNLLGFTHAGALHRVTE